MTEIRSTDPSMIEDRRTPDQRKDYYTSRQEAHKNKKYNKTTLANVYVNDAYKALRAKNRKKEMQNAYSKLAKNYLTRKK
jgi:hypothetical protein